ncbi:major facilitator superfamily domain-containing protein [Ampelomyces quisqualis]|uniref:Major facilitator superfamily domain-containing protein n=1 Tax=Ampelomyces quisqualis TaxID=50730 RepID=A0A6A5QZU0_AMPQU|nr:major facilitator superfamily domain-containing protein [Ampelomyces quisqualis]
MNEHAPTRSGSVAHRPAPRTPWPVWIVFLLIALTSLANRLLNLPLNRIIEARCCRQHYLQHNPSLIDAGGEVPERLCKIRPVQERLVWLETALFLFITVGDIMVAVPFASISDHLGRRIVIMLNVFASSGLFLWLLVVGASTNQIPVEAMLGAPLLVLIGGGDCAYDSVILAYLSEFARDDKTRTSYFAYMSAISMTFSLFGPALASVTMLRNLWLPYYLGLGLLVCAVPLAMLLPGAVPTAGYERVLNTNCSDNEDETTALLDNVSSARDVHNHTTQKDTMLSTIFIELTKIVGFVFGSRMVTQTLFIVILLGLAKNSNEILAVVLSKRYEKTFVEVGYMLSIRAAVNVVVFIVLVPQFLRLWNRKYPGLQTTADFLGASGSIFLSCLGTFFLALASSLWAAVLALVVQGLGAASSVFVLSLVRSPLVTAEDDDAIGRMFSIVVMTQKIGELIGTPLFAALWVKGLRIGGTLLGLPYFVASVSDSV